MESHAQIKNNLKQLRLSSFYEGFEVLIEDAIQSKMSYADFLLLLTQDEIERRKIKKQENIIKRANLGKFNKLMEFDFDFNPDINRQKIMSFSSCDFIRKNQNILFVGPTGVGKTFLAKALAYQACTHGFTALFMRTKKMLDFVFSGKADNSMQKKLKQLLKPDLLVLDDWGLQAFPNHLLEILNEIVSERYEKGSIIVTSNRPIEKWNELFSEPVVCSALLDRLFHNAHKIQIKGKSYRKSL